jgi:hypothetical protein
MDFDLITFAKLSKTAGLPATGVGKFDKLKHLSRHWPPSCRGQI